eukprot:GHVR01059302.1.p1 GENE.GHVR01059302.1~~GHVR01059302.1.p1  ORF type:complete len:140 (-),score=33.64 GHVR01059302.1:32-451(-)
MTGNGIVDITMYNNEYKNIKEIFDKSQNIIEGIEKLSQLLYCCENYKIEEIRLTREVGCRGACTVQWESDNIAFKCLDCEMDPTCAICCDCFFNSNHDTHAWRMIRTGGGCCDCGDPAVGIITKIININYKNNKYKLQK